MNVFITGLNQLCDVDIDECLDETNCNATDDDGFPTERCINTAGSFHCVCENGYTGDPEGNTLNWKDGVMKYGCYDADDCEFSPCQNGGTCTDFGVLSLGCECVARSSRFL